MKHLFGLLLGAALVTPVFPAGARDVVDADITAGDTITWSNDTVYTLKEKVFVEDGAVLNIKAGTVIKGVELTGAEASALIICRGAKIYANGNQLHPIIFTCASDNLSNLGPSDKGLWGGLIILGKAKTNEVEDQIEGVSAGDDRAKYGGTDDADNSGVLRYVSVRHSGATIAPDNELNGISLGAVGSGTVLEYVETYASSDDGFEWFGGSVNGKNLVASFCDDDGFDIDQGYHGKLQFLFCIQDSIETKSANWAGEWDGDDTKGAEPYGLWTIYNATFIGGGSTANSGNAAIILKANGGANVYNSIFTNFKKDRALVVEDLQDASQDARKRFEAGHIVFKNNIWWNFGSATVIDSVIRWTFKDSAGSTKYNYAPELSDSIKAWSNVMENPKIRRIAYGKSVQLDPTVDTSGPAYKQLAAYPSGDAYFTPVAFKGAFGGANWTAYWTAMWDDGILAEPVSSGKVEKLVYDNDINKDAKITFDKDTVYILVGKVFVEEGAVLTIEPGTVVKGSEATGVDASALIICKGAKLIADGRKNAPIIFTTYSDDVGNPDDLDESDKGLWGGVVLLGKAKTNQADPSVEGIASGDPRTKFGGSDNEDSSGVLRYVSIRHSGAAIAPDNELNGLSIAGVGSKTVLENVEVFASSDDGFEWWGGTVNGRHLIAAYCDDDGFDIDQGFRGTLQFLFSIQDSVSSRSANWAGEWDGDDTKGAEPFGYWTMANATFIGGGQTANSGNGGIVFKANAGAGVFNSLFNGFKKDRAVVVEDLQDQSQDSRKRFESGDIVFKGNLFWDFGGATVIDSTLRWMYKDAGGSTVYPAAKEFCDSIKAWNNSYADPKLTIAYMHGSGKLLPQPQKESPAFSDIAALPGSTGLEEVSYKGAFCNENWAEGWSFLSNAGYFGEFSQVLPIIAERQHKLPAGDFSVHAGGTNLSVRYSLPDNRNVSIHLFSVSGRRVTQLFNGVQNAGNHLLTYNINSITCGTYLCSITAGSQVITKRVTILR